MYTPLTCNFLKIGHTNGKSLKMEGFTVHVAIAVTVGAIIGTLVNIFVG